MKYIIPGPPIPQTRHRLGKGHFYDPNAQHKETIGLILISQSKGKTLQGPLAAKLSFFMPIPQHLSQKKQHQLINQYHHKKNADLDNLIKLILDAANNVLYNDDSQIASISAIKKYDTNPRTELILEKLPTLL